MIQIEHDHLGASGDYSINVKAVNPSPSNFTGVYLQSITNRAAHRPYYGYGRNFTAVKFSLLTSLERPGKKMAVNRYNGRQHSIALKACE